MNVNFEFTARETPQQNSIVEVGFATLLKIGLAMMIAAKVPKKNRYMFFRKAFETATHLDGLTLITLDNVIATRYEHWGAKIPEWAKTLRTWGEAGVVKLGVKRKCKIDERGTTCMFVGYTNQHASDVYVIWDGEKNRVHTSRDIVWLKRMYYEEKPQEDMVPINYIEEREFIGDETLDENKNSTENSDPENS